MRIIYVLALFGITALGVHTYLNEPNPYDHYYKLAEAFTRNPALVRSITATENNSQYVEYFPDKHCLIWWTIPPNVRVQAAVYQKGHVASVRFISRNQAPGRGQYLGHNPVNPAVISFRFYARSRCNRSLGRKHPGVQANTPVQTAPQRATTNSARSTDNRPVRLEKPHVIKVQHALKKLGYRIGSVDGIFGKKTSAAVRAWQVRYGYYQTGRLTLAQYQRLTR